VSYSPRCGQLSLPRKSRQGRFSCLDLIDQRATAIDEIAARIEVVMAPFRGPGSYLDDSGDLHEGG
jgi:hypothetical protein